MNTLVFDIETIPDIEAGRKLYNLGDLDDEQVSQVMFTQRRQQTDGTSDFLRHHLHKIVAISVVLSNHEQLRVWSLGEIDSSEEEIVQRFFDGIEKYSPTLVSWNGGGFDLPVLHYRALHYGVNAARYWENGGDDQSFRWNNYLSRYHERHTDLMDVLAAYQPRASVPLTELATILGFPGKMGMSGDKVWECYQNNEVEKIRDYCETDVLNTYLIYLRYELTRGNKTATSYQLECDRLRDYLQDEDKQHFNEFLQAWQE